MKNIFIASFIAIGLLQVDMGFARNDGSYDWKHTAPTADDLRAATYIENQAIKGSCEDQLINAVKKGDLKSVKTFIKNGANLEMKDNQDRTALMRAAEKGDSEIVKILLDAGAKVSAKDTYGWTAFFIAADKNHVEVVKMLLARGAASEKNFKDIFVTSAFQNKTEMVKALISADADIDYDTLYTAYMMVNRRNTELCNLIEEALNKKKSQ